ncbi:MAG: hypothetical protein A2X19_04935 [Bacteroidetes bacterium GWE2_39_28]|nr:MAG: hypothetical protein A2X19_04935 [Bacteroidetes bacterium GWE2_39_28]OFY15298.1 MAG: hypothetical protein A2X16_09165 [Bacteroidetes bacterium GWF2_39_10]OFZ09204.1 MAG: hypothetical protein A2322_09270 [Bacteroidetes bacterium RIFOXYB2_FULL_39_7]OFZ11145.1 MAG: hypothetical protein A2465_02400 [Bacteroidetes bacterium RIFOXYC2_FULL_39_11]HCT93933.1 hypothetical protein [Rikenellaceae bacterium]
MFKSCSPYLKMFSEEGIKWNFSLDNKLLHYAMEEDKLIFLHIGYFSNISLRESTYKLFSDPETISLLNENFVCLIEDKEDNPESFLLAQDLLLLNQDFTYGPVNMFIMPNRRPLIAFSNSDPEHFKELAKRILMAKSEKREKLFEMSEELSRRVLSMGIAKKSEKKPEIDSVFFKLYLKTWFDSIFQTDFLSGFKPFTPSPVSLFTVIEYLKTFPDTEISERVENLLDHFQYSPLFDVIDGGFFRQAVDYTCLQPLFEKTLAENSQFLALYSLAYDYFKKDSYKKTALLISEFIQNELSNGKGGYYNSTTLLGDIKESVYYHYSINELKILFPDRYNEVADAIGLDLNANPQKRQLPVRGIDTLNVITLDELKKLRSRRAEHRSYFKDERSITASNSMCVKSFTIASRYLSDPTLYQKAVENFEFIIYNNVSKEDARLFRYTCRSQSYLLGYLSDYAHFIEASLELFQIKGDVEYFYVAKRYLEMTIERFFKPENGMFSKSEIGTPGHTVTFKRESNIDFMKPSANSVMAGNLLTMYSITSDELHLKMASQQLLNVASNLMNSGPMLSNWAHKILIYINMGLSAK